MVGIIFSEIIKDFEKTFIQDFLSFLGSGCIAKANAFGIPEILFIEVSLRLVVASDARSYDRIEVVLIKGYFSSK